MRAESRRRPFGVRAGLRGFPPTAAGVQFSHSRSDDLFTEIRHLRDDGLGNVYARLSVFGARIGLG